MEECFVCTSPIDVAAVSSCGHVTCHLCAFRQRRLYAKHACLFCRSQDAKLVFTDNYKSSRFEDIPTSAYIPQQKGDLGIRYTSKSAREKTLALLEYRCPSCQRQFDGFKQVNDHVQQAHHKQFCSTCANAKKFFPSELKLYSASDLSKHLKTGDYDGFTGHPSCKFCDKQYFYSEDELNQHMRNNHQKCEVCHSIDPSKPQYFKNVDSLYKHLQSAHYPCKVPSCLDQKVIVFGDLLELQTHMAKEHPEISRGRINFGQHLSTGTSFQIESPNSSIRKAGAEDDTTSLETKRKRFELRARHYLNNDSARYDEFNKLNTNFRSGNISASQLIGKYQELFANGQQVDIPILVFEFSQFFPENSKQRLALTNVNKSNMDAKKFEETFPSLPGSSASSRPMMKSSSSRKEKFPALSRPQSSSSVSSLPSLGSKTASTTASKKPIARGIPTNAPINGHTIPGYNPINTNKKSSVKKSSPSPSSSWASISNSGNSISSDNLFQTPQHTINSRSLSSLDMSNASWGNDPIKARVGGLNKSTNGELFPALPKLESKKKQIPRVNPIVDHAPQWANGFNKNDTANDNGDELSQLLNSGLKIKFNTKGKKKK